MLVSEGIQISKNDQLFIESYALENAKDYKSNGRKYETKVKNIIVGKSGELAFAKIYNLKKEDEDLQVDFSKGADPGYDFLTRKNVKIDVKTLDKNYKQKVYVNASYLRADIYVLMLFEDSTNEYFYQGYVKHKDVKENLHFDDVFKSYYIDRSLFKNDKIFIL